MKNLIAFFVVSVIALTGAVSIASPSFATESKSAAELRQDMRKLWEDHIVYTRNWVISEVAGLPDRNVVAKRLLKNQEDIGNAIKPYYGDDAGSKLTALLKEHIMLATEVVKAAKAGEKGKLDNEQKKWKANAEEIAAFLSKANPNWQEADIKDMMDQHLEFTTNETVARLHKDWAADIKAYDKNHEHMLMFSDMLTDGIARQFPDKFATR